MLRGIIVVLIGACSYGVLSTFVKFAYQDGYTLGDVTGVQALFGAMILWLAFAFSPKKPVVKHKHKFSVLLLAGVSSAAIAILYYQSVMLISNALAIVLLMQFVWMSIVIDLILYKKRITVTQMLSIAAIWVGTFLASGFLEADLKSVNMAGVGFGLGAALAYAIFLTINGRVGLDYSPLKKSALMMTGATVFIFTMFPPYFLVTDALHGSLFPLGLTIAIFGTVIPPLAYAYGIPKIGIAKSSIISAAELPVAVCMATFVLHEEVTLLNWIGVLIILVAMIVPNLKNGEAELKSATT